MHHIERKQTILPCGWTVAESWAALRKCWLGFKIAHANGDSSLKKDYARMITKIQTEMGIAVTEFDEDIIDEETALNSISQTDCSFERSMGCSESQSNNNQEIEELPDYDSLLKQPQTIRVKPAPRDEIFATYEARDNFCTSRPPDDKSERPDTNIFSTVEARNSFCSWVPPDDRSIRTPDVVKKHTTYYNKSEPYHAFVVATNQDMKEQEEDKDVEVDTHTAYYDWSQAYKIPDEEEEQTVEQIMEDEDDDEDQIQENEESPTVDVDSHITYSNRSEAYNTYGQGEDDDAQSPFDLDLDKHVLRNKKSCLYKS